ncbi:MAG: site-specific DNA-methyltransferase [Thermoplasmata archaeon]|nr:site-specific DNA-methyltransferase [Thermoplasmata archaeon]
MRKSRERIPEIRAVLGDARKMPSIAPASVHLVVTSPPYPMIPQWDEQFGAWGAHGFDAMHARLAEVWRSCRDALVPGGILAINVGDALRSIDGEFRLWPNHVRVTLACEALGLRSLPYILWKKPTNRPNAFLGSGFLPPNAYVTLDCEFILLFRKGSPRRFPPRDDARYASRYTKPERDIWFSQVWSVRGARQDGVARRTGAFPPEIPERLIRMFSVTGETVLDPFAGTGTTLWAAARLRRNAIGVEIDPERYEALVRRIPAERVATSRSRAGAPSLR